MVGVFFGVESHYSLNLYFRKSIQVYMMCEDGEQHRKTFKSSYFSLLKADITLTRERAPETPTFKGTSK